ncbi:hypothetical protein [Streptomyces sp. NPDC057580]|uniref:hypothetical protein n=1 Tax=Streptomyces sp. NPDC057580 TaxID=3346173 RepID=UPI0036D18949
MPTAVAERARIMANPAAPADLRDRQTELREQEWRREVARIAAEAELTREAQRAELTGRWGLDRYTRPSGRSRSSHTAGHPARRSICW